MTTADRGDANMKTPFKLGRRPPLDGLRAVAILGVIGFHYGPTKVGGGYLGVDVFFVLSGFLITSLLVQERENTGGISLPAFYLRRARRLLPALFIMLVAVAVYGAMYPHRPESAHVWRDIAAAVFYVANWVHGLGHSLETGLLAHTWSLSVEEQFYLIWPAVLVFLLARKASRRTIAIVLAVGVVASFVDTNLLYRGGVHAPRIAYGLDTRGIGLLIGCLLGLAVGWQVIPERLRRWATITPWIGLAVLAVVFLSHRYFLLNPPPIFRDFIEGPPIVDLATVLVIFGVIYADRTLPARALSLPFMVWIGQVSYGLYLWHFPMAKWVERANLDLGLGDPGLQVMKALATLAVVVLSFYLVEKPILERRRPLRRDVVHVES